MLNNDTVSGEAVVTSPDTENSAKACDHSSARSLLHIAVCLLDASGNEPLLYVAVDDVRAVAIADIVRSLAPKACVLHLVASDALPGDDAPASPANAGQRVATLRKLREWHGRAEMPLIFITSAEATAQLYAPPAAFDGQHPLLRKGDPIDLSTFESTCTELGYITDDRIDEPGEVAVRGSVVDVFPVDAVLPIRLEVIDGQIDAIRQYDPADQRTLDELEQVEIGLASEPDATAGVSLLAHITQGKLVEEPSAAGRRANFLKLAKDAARFGRAVRTTLDRERWSEESSAWTRINLFTDGAEPIPRFVETRSPVAALARAVAPVFEADGQLVIVGNARDLRFLRPQLAKRFNRDFVELADWTDIADSGSTATIKASADAGFVRESLLVVAAADMLGSRAMTTTAAVSSTVNALDGLADLHVGDVVVHDEHGIARLGGIETMPDSTEVEAADAIALEFANDTRRLVPVLEANRIWRYGGDADAVSLDKLDGSSWQKRRSQIEEALAHTATALVAMAAEREARSVPKIAPDPATYEKFVSCFPFTETPDQARAISAVRDDLASGSPIERLVIGDVGFGKTEVALRAVAMVAFAGGQVAIAAPTTVLVRQHLALFKSRFEESGIGVAGLSRLSTAAEKKAVKAGLADGSISVVVGTAAVAGKGVDYSNLQLVIIDEEQRFGAADKAKLRALHDGHVLTLSATPIPRTLQAALIGLQKLSVIATPPARRQPIRTTIDEWSDSRIRSALLRERARRGQSFVVVPRIEDIEGIRARLATLFPEGEIVEAHGKMAADDLDIAMTDFAAGRGDVLLATNIIEAGLDVPRANTMIVWRPDRFGLSQLHQLRGRVGRGSRRGQILLTTDGTVKIAEATLKRLRTLQAFDLLGAGFGISARDLDMRGAGDLLGESQTGHMRLIGVDLYQHLLGQALRSARGENVDDWQPQIITGISGNLPCSWLSDTDLRIQLYGRLSRLRTLIEIDMFEEELSDRFGSLPPPAEILVALSRIRALARMAGVAVINAGPAAIALTPHPATDTSKWAAANLIPLGERFIIQQPTDDALLRITKLIEVLESL